MGRRTAPLPTSRRAAGHGVEVGPGLGLFAGAAGSRWRVSRRGLGRRLCWHAHGITTTFSKHHPSVGLIDAIFCRHWQLSERHHVLHEHLLRAGGVGFGCDDHGAIHHLNGRPHQELQDADGVRVTHLRVASGGEIVEHALASSPLPAQLID